MAKQLRLLSENNTSTRDKTNGYLSRTRAKTLAPKTIYIIPLVLPDKDSKYVLVKIFCLLRLRVNLTFGLWFVVVICNRHSTSHITSPGCIPRLCWVRVCFNLLPLKELKFNPELSVTDFKVIYYITVCKILTKETSIIIIIIIILV